MKVKINGQQQFDEFFNSLNHCYNWSWTLARVKAKDPEFDLFFTINRDNVLTTWSGGEQEAGSFITYEEWKLIQDMK